MLSRLQISNALFVLGFWLFWIPAGVYAQILPSYKTVAYATPYPPETTNSDKVVADASNKLHLVFIDGVQLRHTYSTDFGWSWNTPTSVTTMQAVSPALARDDAGNIGVTFVVPTGASTTGSLYYAYWTGTAWTPPVLISNVGLARTPSMAGYGDRMHLTWSDGVRVRYASVQTMAPVALPTAETVMEGSICNAGGFRLPSIAVAAPTSGVQPIVRVAFYFQFSADCGSSATAGIQVLERPTAVGSGFWPAYEPNSSHGGSIFTHTEAASSPEVSSLSLSANRDSGYFFLLYCFRPNSNGLWQAWLARGTRAIDTWQRAPFFENQQTAPFTLDIVAYQHTEELFKAGYSRGDYGRTEIKIGAWSLGAQMPSFYYAGPVKSQYGRVPHVIDFEIENPVTFEYRGINVVYSYRYPGGAYDEIRTDPFSYH